ncbi:hypothetical protein LTR36_010157 [Oleoguttula mirabilis]|uniref:Uncharacterized protein n=1 Tax=Oleoguttula mirabilis TaxID=1507867 RepID=A0AAV9JTF7_9PEZI|nr:hypothetical protein LTR36_010157 [Oleoguttula mirabilis]
MTITFPNRRRSPYYLVARHCTYADDTAEPDTFSMVEGVYESKADALHVLKGLREEVVERRARRGVDATRPRKTGAAVAGAAGKEEAAPPASGPDPDLEEEYPFAYKRGPIENTSGSFMGYGHQLEDDRGCKQTMWMEKIAVTHAGVVGGGEEDVEPGWMDTSSDLDEQGGEEEEVEEGMEDFDVEEATEEEGEETMER